MCINNAQNHFWHIQSSVLFDSRKTVQWLGWNSQSRQELWPNSATSLARTMLLLPTIWINRNDPKYVVPIFNAFEIWPFGWSIDSLRVLYPSYQGCTTPSLLQRQLASQLQRVLWLWMQQGQQCSESWMKRSHSTQNTLRHDGQVNI